MIKRPVLDVDGVITIGFKADLSTRKSLINLNHKSKDMSNLYSFAIGVGTKNSSGEWLEVFYPAPILNPEQALAIFLRSAWA